MVTNSKNKRCGRPPGKKDTNRKRILNPNGRIIDVNGPQYNKLLRSGYDESEDGKTLVFNDSFIRKTIPRGRPKKIRVINTHEKVVNPDTKRLIKIDNATFKQLSKKYHYNLNENVFYNEVIDPKHPKKKLNVTDPKVKEYEHRGYIFKKEENKIIKPSIKRESAFKDTLNVYELTIVDELDPVIQFKSLERRETVLLSQSIKKHKGIKFSTGLEIELVKSVDKENTESRYFTFMPKLVSLTSKDGIPEARRVMHQHINGMIDRFTNQGSGWVVNRILRHFIVVNRYAPLSAKSYIKLPPSIQNTRAVINIQNTDDKCFMYCLGRALDPNPEKDNLYRVSKHLKRACIKLGLDKIEMPVSMKDIPKIEKMLDVDISVFGHNGNEIYPIGKIKQSDKKMIDLLFTSNEDTNHYVLIKDLNSLCNGKTKNTNRKYLCRHCIQFFPSQDRLDKHIPDCMIINGTQAVELPKKGTIISFKNLKATLDIPFVVFADYESLVVPVEIDKNITSQTIKTHEHKCCSFGYKVVCSYDDKLSLPYKSYRGEDSMEKFFESIFELEKVIGDHVKKFKKSKPVLTNTQEKEFQSTKECYLCKNRFTKKNYKVRDHCHITEKFRGTACNECNLQLQNSYEIPIVVHNLRGYDSHLMMQTIGKFKRPINVIPNNMEKYTSFTIGTEIEYFDQKTNSMETRIVYNLKFIDSLQFMPSSLSQLVTNLKTNGIDKFEYNNQEFKNDTEIMTRKGVYPYSYMDNMEKFNVSPEVLQISDFQNDSRICE